MNVCRNARASAATPRFRHAIRQARGQTATAALLAATRQNKCRRRMWTARRSRSTFSPAHLTPAARCSRAYPWIRLPERAASSACSRGMPSATTLCGASTAPRSSPPKLTRPSSSPSLSLSRSRSPAWTAATCRCALLVTAACGQKRHSAPWRSNSASVVADTQRLSIAPGRVRQLTTPARAPGTALSMAPMTWTWTWT